LIFSSVADHGRSGDDALATTGTTPVNIMRFAVAVRDARAGGSWSVYQAGAAPSEESESAVAGPSRVRLDQVARLVEAAIRPCFPYGYLYDTELRLTLREDVRGRVDGGVNGGADVDADGGRSTAAGDGDCGGPAFDAAVMAINAASASLCVSDIPFDGPVGAVRVVRDAADAPLRCALSGEEPRVRGPGSIDLLYAGTLRGAVLVRLASGDARYEDVCDAIMFAADALTPMLHAQMDLALAGGKEPRACVILSPNRDCVVTTRAVTRRGIEAALTDQTLGPEGRRDALDEVGLVTGRALRKHFGTLTEYDLVEAAALARYETFRDLVATRDARPDARARRETRTVYAELAAFPGAHGSAIFQRGETQALASVEVDVGKSSSSNSSSSSSSTSSKNSNDSNGNGVGARGRLALELHSAPFSHCVSGAPALSAARDGLLDLSRLAFSAALAAGVIPATVMASGVRVSCDLLATDGAAAPMALNAAFLALADALANPAFASSSSSSSSSGASFATSRLCTDGIAASTVSILTTVEAGTSRAVHQDLLTDSCSLEESLADATLCVAGTGGESGGVLAATLAVQGAPIAAAALCDALWEARPTVAATAGFAAALSQGYERSRGVRKTAVARIATPNEDSFPAIQQLLPGAGGDGDGSAQ
jgi:ribonuclease PH